MGEIYPCGSKDTNERMAALLQREGWCKVTEGRVQVRQKFLDLLEQDTSPSLVKSWIDEWRTLFPAGVKTAGRPLRGDKQGVLKKMTAFCKANPKYTKEEIFEATKQYIFEKRLENFKFTTTADYFILKNGVSLLGSLIEELRDKEELMRNKPEEGSAWHKEV